MPRDRVVWGAAGLASIAFGAGGLLVDVPIGSLAGLAGWLVGAAIVHDAIVAPAVVALGVLVARIPPRLRTYVQAALIVGAMIASIAVVLVVRRGSQPAVKAILRRDYVAGAGLLLAVVAVLAAAAYAVHVLRDRVRTPDRRREG